MTELSIDEIQAAASHPLNQAALQSMGPDGDRLEDLYVLLGADISWMLRHPPELLLTRWAEYETLLAPEVQELFGALRRWRTPADPSAQQRDEALLIGQQAPLVAPGTEEITQLSGEALRRAIVQHLAAVMNRLRSEVDYAATRLLGKQSEEPGEGLPAIDASELDERTQELLGLMCRHARPIWQVYCELGDWERTFGGMSLEQLSQEWKEMMTERSLQSVMGRAGWSDDIIGRCAPISALTGEDQRSAILELIKAARRELIDEFAASVTAVSLADEAD